MRGAAKKTRWGTRLARAALPLAVLAVVLLASPASASLPRPPAVGGITGDSLAAAAAPAWPPLHTEPAEPSPAPEPARPRLHLFGSGSHGFGLFARERPGYDAGFLLETRLWAFELDSGGLVGLGRLQVLESVGVLRLFTTERRRGPRNRCYDPELGGFITADPMGYVDGPSMYQFAGYSPVNFGDPTGLEAGWIVAREHQQLEETGIDPHRYGKGEVPQEVLLAVQNLRMAWTALGGYDFFAPLCFPLCPPTEEMGEQLEEDARRYLTLAPGSICPRPEREGGEAPTSEASPQEREALPSERGLRLSLPCPSPHDERHDRPGASTADRLAHARDGRGARGREGFAS